MQALDVSLTPSEVEQLSNAIPQDKVSHLRAMVKCFITNIEATTWKLKVTCLCWNPIDARHIKLLICLCTGEC